MYRLPAKYLIVIVLTAKKTQNFGLLWLNTVRFYDLKMPEFPDDDWSKKVFFFRREAFLSRNVSLISLTVVSSALTVLLLECSTALTVGDKRFCWEDSHWFMNTATNKKAPSKACLSPTVRAVQHSTSRTVRAEETTVRDTKETFQDK